MTDLRGMGGPPIFSGDYEKSREWMAKLTSFVCARSGGGMQWSSWAEKWTESIMDSDIDEYFEQDTSTVKSSSRDLQQLLYDRTQGRAWEDVHSAGVGDGLDAYRGLKSGTKRAVINIKGLARHCEGTAGAFQPEDLKVKIMIETCPRELRD